MNEDQKYEEEEEVVVFSCQSLTSFLLNVNLLTPCIDIFLIYDYVQYIPTNPTASRIITNKEMF